MVLDGTPESIVSSMMRALIRSPRINDGEQFNHITDGTVIHTVIISDNGHIHLLRRPATVRFKKKKRRLWYDGIDELIVSARKEMRKRHTRTFHRPWNSSG